VRGIAVLLIFFSALPSISVAQTDQTKSLFQAVPFNQWVTEGPKEELPWRTRISSPELSLHQRMLVRFEVKLEGREVLKRCCDGRAVALLEIIDFRGQSFRNYTVENIRQDRADLNQSVVVLSWDVFLLPGDYQIAMALYYPGHAGHSLLLKKLVVSRPQNDPLPEAWHGLPTVEFCDPQPEGLDEFLLPHVEGQLNLRVNNQRPIRVEILENLTPYTAELRTPFWYQQRLRIFLPILKSLAQLKTRNGSLNLATMDFARSRLTFEQRDIPDGHLDLTRLKDSLAADATSRVDVHDMRKPDHYGKFFVQEISERLDTDSRANVSQANRPLLVLIIVSGDMALGAAPIAPRPNGDTLVFYLRCDFAPVGVFHGPVNSNSNLPSAWQISSLKAEQLDDGIGKALKNLKPHSYTVNSADSVRKAMAAIIGELSLM
jgi:hypothetical protein